MAGDGKQTLPDAVLDFLLQVVKVRLVGRLH